MIRRYFAPALVLSLLAGCGSEPPQVAAPPAPSASAPAPVASASPPTPAEPPPPPEPTPEEKKKAEAAKKLTEDRAKWDEQLKAEIARWTPEVHAAAKALADKTYPNAKAGIKAALAGTHRVPANAARDQYRHPLETLEFFGLKPNMSVLDIGPGEGWYTELLAPTLAQKGKYFATNGDPNGPIDLRPTYYAQKFKGFLDKAPEIYGKVQTITIDGKDPKLGQDGTLDMVILMRGLHGWKNSGTLAQWLGEVHKALKPNGVFGIEEHRAAEGANPDETAKKGYLPEKWVIEQIEAAGFKLAGKSEINANAKDTKDYGEGVWALPPSFAYGEKEHAKYAAIGESDRMTLKFTKVAPKKGAAPKADAKPAKK